MNTKMKTRIISLLLCFVMLGMLPMTAMARTVIPVKPEGGMNLQVDTNGKLRWDSVAGATGYNIDICKHPGDFLLTTDRVGAGETSYALFDKMDDLGYDNGTYRVKINVSGSAPAYTYSTLLFYYDSPYEKLSAPANLRWNGNTAEWDAVPDADYYNVYIRNTTTTGSLSVRSNLTGTSVDLSYLSPQAGWYFEVITYGSGYRNSAVSESPRKDGGSRTIIPVGGNGAMNLKLLENGMLLWDKYDDAISYTVNVFEHPGSFVLKTINVDKANQHCELIDAMDKERYDNGDYRIEVRANGSSAEHPYDSMIIYYDSPYTKLTTPANPHWNGLFASWDAVPGAQYYNVYVYDTTTGSLRVKSHVEETFVALTDFNPQPGWYFEVIAYGSGYRYSAAGTSPRKGFIVGADTYDASEDELYSGGRVKVETEAGSHDYDYIGESFEVSNNSEVAMTALPDDGYEFVEWRIGSETGESFSKAKSIGFRADKSMHLYAVFHKSFPEGVGSSANNPAVCSSYWEFKYAMENDNIRYVALCNAEDMLPMIPHDEEQDPGGIIRTAIVVRGTKDLNLLGNAVFRCPLTRDYDLKYYIELINLTDAANSNLYIHGPGSLTYVGGTLDFVNSVIKMEGGNLTVDGATIRGSNGYHTGFCYGINAIFGSVCIRGGATIIGENYGCYGGISALTLGSEGVNRSLSVSIFDGTFYVERDEGNSDEDHGISVNNDIGLRIYGMTTDGIKLRRYAADTLADYVMDGTVMTVNGVPTDPASCGTTSGVVEVYKEISAVDIHVNSPEAGKAPAMYSGDVYMVPEGVTAYDLVWYENGQPWNLNSGSERFEAGSTYTVEIILVADEGVNFAKSLTSATINYKNAEVSAFAGNWEKGIVLTVDFGACPVTISDVELNVTAPKEGNTISYSVTDSSDAYGAVGSGNTITNYRAWYVSNDGSNYTRMSQGDKFVAGKYYKFSTWVRTADGYEFPLYDNGVSIVPNVSATVNGYYAKVTKAYDQDPSRVIVVEYDFGMCNDSVIENITVVDVTAPVAGEHPSYTYNILGSGYQMDTSKNAYLDAYWKNPPEKWYYVKNGISWWDVTDGGYDYVYENDTFIPGHQYQCKVYLKVEDGFEFAYNNGTPTVTATMNGNTAEITMYGSGLQWQQQVKAD